MGGRLPIYIAAQLFVAIFILVAESTCPKWHCEDIDSVCHPSYQFPLKSDEGENYDYRYYVPHGFAVKPKEFVRKLCPVSKSHLRLLQDFADRIPSDYWREPNAEFSAPGQTIDYKQAVVHFPENRSVPYAPYRMYPLAIDAHRWISPILEQILSRYNYSGMPGPNYLTKNIPRLFFARLGPFTKQRGHRDSGWSSFAPHKIHIPLDDAGGEAHFYGQLDGAMKPFHLEVGFAYEVNNLIHHYAHNLGPYTRTHLLLEYSLHDVSSQWTDDIGPPTNSEARKAKQGWQPQQKKTKQREKRRKQVGGVPVSEEL